MQELVTHFHSILNKSDVVEQFKQISQNFMMGTYNALPYYEHCVSALGDKFDEIFPELLALLPDISKQQVKINCSSSFLDLMAKLD